MSAGYPQMSNVAAHGAGMRGRRMHAELRPHHMYQDSGCHFPSPAPMRVYCNPAAFQRVCGCGEYHNMTAAYGSSRPLERYY